MKAAEMKDWSIAAAVVAGGGALLWWFLKTDSRELRYDIPELWERIVPAYNDAPAADRQSVQNRLPVLTGYAKKIADAPGFVNDNEQAVVSVFKLLRSRYELFWMAKLFQSGPPVPSLGVFEGPGNPNLGEFLDAFLDGSDWDQVVDLIADLPKYTSQ